MSYLTQSDDELLEAVITGLEGEGFAFNRLTTELQVYLATCLGDANAWKTKSVNRMLAELNSHFSGSTVSYLTMGYGQLLDTLNITLAGSGGGGDYHADAVHFDGSTALLSMAFSGGADSPFWLSSFWIKTTLANYYGTIVTAQTVDLDASLTCSDITAQNTGIMGGSLQTADFSKGFFVNTQGVVNDGVWHNIIHQIDTNHADGAKIGRVLIDGVLVAVDTFDGSTAFSVSFGIAAMIGAIGYDLNSGPTVLNFPLTGDLADVQFYPGVNLDMTNPANVAKFIADGKPVDPAIASAAFGDPAMLFSGNAASFGTNQGTGGTFTTQGSLTNATTSPSD